MTYACTSRVAALCILISLVSVHSVGAQQPAAQDPANADGVFVIENACFRYEFGGDGRNLHFVDKATGTDYCKGDADTPIASVKIGDAVVPASAAAYQDGKLTLDFGESGAQATVGVTVGDRHILLEVKSVAGEDVEQLTFANVELTLTGTLNDPFAACALALNLQTNVSEIPGPMRRLHATCYRRFTFEGAKVALIGCPQAQLRDVMKEVVSAADELPRSNIGGPWALDVPTNRGSYLFDFGQCTEETVDDWVAFVKRLGLNQVDFHTGRSLRFGDCRPHPDLFPNGRASVKAVIDKLHAAGIQAGLHTYAFFIAKDTPYVTPVPDPRLGKDATFTLSGDLDAEAKAVPVDESTETMSTTTGFFVRNSVTVQIDDELITYASIAKEAPFAFTECTRGAYGTTAAPHAKGAKVHHLKECFGLFTPGADTTLLAEVASNAASTFNECGFDMMYLDALDGEDILAGGENSWHYGSKFVFEIANRLEKPALFEMSTFHHHLWYVRARMGAWDHPRRSHKHFIDIHLAANQSGAGMFLPMNLGWWAAKVWTGPRGEPTFPDDIEYLMGKGLGAGMGISLMGVNPGNIDGNPAYQRLAPIFRQYEELRHAGYFPESVKAQLRTPGREFTLEQTGDNAWQFREMHYDKHKVCGLDGWSDAWTADNPFGEQPVQLRIEALCSAASYDAPEAVVVEDFSDIAEAYVSKQAKTGVEGGLTRSADQVKVGDASARFTARSPHAERKGTWLKRGRTFAPILNLESQQALGVWVHGDGQGEVLNFQMTSPHHITHAQGDGLVTVDFTGWRYFELIEAEGETIYDLGMPYANPYSTLREDVSFRHVETFSLWYANLPADKDVTCYVAPVKALPVVDITLRNPSVTVGGQRITFPVNIATGSYLEFRGLNDCKVYGPKGELIAEVKPEGPVPALAPGGNELAFACDVAADDPRPRARVTVMATGAVIE
ncbi:MAG: hypothetical protein GY851_30795 [bacterium]|nr:hypothetical protein [bacterium]